MEEGLLQSSTNFEAQPNTDGGDITPTGASATATPVVVLSTLVALLWLILHWLCCKYHSIKL